MIDGQNDGLGIDERGDLSQLGVIALSQFLSVYEFGDTVVGSWAGNAARSPDHGDEEEEEEKAKRARWLL